MSNNKTIISPFLTLIIVVAIFFSLSNCKKDRIISDSSAKVEFSKDTLIFDTVFSTIGSTYRRFTVRNKHSKKIIISQIRLNQGTNSDYRINVDGIPTTDIRDVEIEGGDSIFIYAEVTVDPNNVLTPYIVEDKIVFTTNGNQQEVKLITWGQNAYFHYNEVVCNETWLNDKPHVLYGITAVGYPGVDSNCFLNIPAGTKIYGYNNAVLYVYKSTLNIQGTLGSEVEFRGSRLEPEYDNTPGQWFGIRMFEPTESTIEYADIKNATVGIWVDTSSGTDKVNINYTKSGNHTYASLYCQGARIKSENSLYYNSGVYSGLFNIGGDYDFNHCTFGNFWSSTSRTTALMVLNNYYIGSNNNVYYRPIIKADFNNCIIYGDKDNELFIDTIQGSNPNYTFNHCMIKTNKNINNSHFTNIKKNIGPSFASSLTFKLNSGSQAINFADPLFPTLNGDDLGGSVRTPLYDLGCYEYIP
jgi:hypothetical protein